MCLRKDKRGIGDNEYINIRGFAAKCCREKSGRRQGKHGQGKLKTIFFFFEMGQITACVEPMRMIQ